MLSNIYILVYIYEVFYVLRIMDYKCLFYGVDHLKDSE